jgi:iron complex outermembrane recepter protein
MFAQSSLPAAPIGRPRFMSLLLTGTALALLSTPSAGQALADQTAGTAETIVVSAERRDTPLEKTPVAATVLTGATLERNRIDSFSDLSLHVPNLTYTQFSPQESYLSIRGTLINNNAAGWDDAVTTFIDGVPTTGLGDQNPDLFDLSQIEVLRGPQGTLFGRNVTGGAVILRTLEPSFDQSGKVELSYGNDNAVQARGYVTGPITDTLAGKLSVSVNHRDAFIDNTTLGGQTDDTEEYDLRGQVLWQATEDLQVLLGADFLRDNSGGYPSRLLANFTPALFPGLSYDPNKTNQGFNGFQHREIEGGLARVTWTNPIGVLTSTTGLRNVDDHFPNSTLGDPLNQLIQTNIVQDTQVSQELNFTSPTDQPLTWVGGLFYLHSNKRQGGPVVMAFDPADVAGQFSSDNNYTQTAIQKIATDSYAIYGEATYAILDTLKFTVGARETWESKDGTSSVTDSIVDPAHLFPATAQYSHTWDAFTPKANLSFQAADNLLLYATVTRGFKSGGYDLSGTGASSATNVQLALATPFAPETETSYEIGEKFAGFNNRLVVNGDLFRAEYHNEQISQLVLLSNNQLENITSNAPGVSVSQGAELEVSGVPTDWLTLGTSFAYEDAHFADGSSVPYAPRFQLNLSGEVHFPVPELAGEVSLASDYTYHSTINFNKSEDLPSDIASRTAWNGIVNLHADYVTDDERWRLSLWGKNIANERPLLRASNVGVLFENLAESGNANNALYLVKYFPERTFGLSLTASF